ncbi:MAG: protein translocase subunit SecF [Anaerovoracaceae bacterium]|nr:protein translocase subunit SecF [Bacillota bacterium]MDY2669972.1 protein translocase subunit SecF [Anaerovoracaceae bacterium]
MYELLQNVHFMKNRKIYYIITVTIIVVSLVIGGVRGFNLGIDFTGGTLLEFNMGKEVQISDVQKVLKSQDLDGSVMHAGQNNEDIIIKTGSSLNTDKRTALQKAMNEKFGIKDKALISVENIGPSVGKTLRSSAAKAVAVAVILMLIYIAIRFMIKYGIAAILALANTILIMIGFYGAFHVTINSPFIAAVLTILGYGINDTIVIFDRIRENTGGRSANKSTAGLDLLVDESIRQTVGRSIMTSMTTVAVMIPLIIICGTTIRSFILPILVGVIASTCSSIFIATSLWYDIMRATDKNSPKNRARAKEKRERQLEKEREKKEIAREKERAVKEREKQAKLAERQRRAEEKQQEAERKKKEKEAEQKKDQAGDSSADK